MYYPTESEYGIAPAAAVELGAAVLSVGSALTSGGSFETTSAPISYIHEGTPPSQTFRKCTRQFMISAYIPIVPVPAADPRAPAEKFWFSLQYEYNGNDLREVRVDPLPDKSSTLYKSKFIIGFAPGTVSVPRDPVAAVRFTISGSWEHWDLPFNQKVGLRGALDVRANGDSSIQVTSEKGWVNHRSMTGACAVAPPVLPKVDVPKIPVPQPYFLTVHFPVGLHKFSEQDGDRIVNWFLEKLPSTTREKIIAGTLPIVLQGYASTTGPKEFNRLLAERRALTVRRILERPAGPDAKIKVFSYGEHKARTTDSIESLPERRVDISVVDTTFR